MTKKLKKQIIILIVIILAVSLSIAVFYFSVSAKMSFIPTMTFDEMLSYTTEDNENAAIAVGIIKDGKKTFKIYGSNAEEQINESHIYEIGSVTKTFTASLISKAVTEGKIDLNAQISEYITLPEKGYYPTIERLITHTSGYKGYYLENQMASNFFKGEENDFYGIDKKTMIKRIGKINLQDRDYDFNYSNFGMAVLGLVLENVYEKNYSELIDDFVSYEIGLKNTHISDGSGDLSGYWRWSKEDAYLPAGALVSSIEDMMDYAEMQISNPPVYLKNTHTPIKDVNVVSKQNEKMGIHVDSCGMGWITDKENAIVWHNGATSNFNCYIAFDEENQIGVVVLSNLSPSYRIPSTVMGVRLMKELQNLRLT